MTPIQLKQQRSLQFFLEKDIFNWQKPSIKVMYINIYLQKSINKVGDEILNVMEGA